MHRLRGAAAALGLALSPTALDRFVRYRHLLLDANRRVNLTRIVDPDEVETLHFLDSLSCWLAIRDLASHGRALRIVDVGSGAGFPGLPLAIACPTLSLVLLDSLHKRTAFLESVIAALALTNVQVVTARAEDAAHDPAHREAYDVALARALAPLPVLLELCLPFVRVGGLLVAPRKGDLAADVAESATALATLGGSSPHLIPVDLPGLRDGRALVVVEKGAPTPARYPRRAGLPARRPLGVDDR